MRNPAGPIALEITKLRRSLKTIDRSLARLVPMVWTAMSNAPISGRHRTPGKLRLSPKRRAQLKLQGQYIGYVRQLKPKQKAEVKRLLEKKGMVTAIAKAKNLMKRSRTA